MRTSHRSAVRIFASLSTSLVVLGGVTTTAAAADTATVRAGCTLNVAVDVVDQHPATLYGLGGVTCQFSQQQFGVFTDLVRDGSIVSSGHNNCGVGTSCSASSGQFVDTVPGAQAWQAHVIVRGPCTCDSWSAVFYH